ncbi:cell division protein FtsL [Dehalobacterium formicoaceticum]|uniref:Cell division protein FtsL n=1 Tax=Dehalobacterium formicoaceticum TaxID=51515 RepID=A0ABT1Y0U3_9FIRM|nr:cell division protein FtsL [Dehalobacterium formicoaceticum]MCR6544474.1 cell division protein FtsL [Dehalobacterium formicoaceticum]
MLEARQISEDYIYEQEPVITRKVIRRKAKSRKAGVMLAKIIVVGSVLLAVVTGLMLTATHAQITYRNSNIIQIKNEISDLQNANERLKLEIARKKSLDRIESIATKELGMIQPGINDIKYVAFDKAAEGTKDAAAPKKESRSVVESASNAKVHPIVLTINKMINQYAYDL